MSIWGKILGASVGFALGGPLGALAGAAAGHYIGRVRADAIAAEGIGGSASFSESENSRRQVSFAVAVIVLAAKLAKADGVVTRDEIETFKQVFHIPIHEVDNVGAIFDEAKASPDNFELYAQQIGIIFGNNPAVLEEFLNALFCIAKSDSVVHPAELQYLKEVANIFGFTSGEFERIAAMHMPGASSDTYQILGVTRDITNKELKAHYRALVLEHHPDKLIAQGLPEEFVEQANEKLARINAAYDQICTERGQK